MCMHIHVVKMVKIIINVASSVLLIVLEKVRMNILSLTL